MSVYVRKRHGQKGRGGGVGLISTHRGTKEVGGGVFICRSLFMYQCFICTTFFTYIGLFWCVWRT